MTPQQYAELLEYANKNNGWRHTLYNRSRLEKTRPLIKYITSHFDTREGVVWSVVFREMGRQVVFRIHNRYEDIKDDIYNYLNGEEFKYGVVEKNN